MCYSPAHVVHMPSMKKRKGTEDVSAAELESARLDHMLLHERTAREHGFTRIAGVDEAGRGPLAGPIVAAAVELLHPVAGLNDSKQVKESQREALYKQLHAEGHRIGIAWISAAQIDVLGIQTANYQAMLKAIEQLAPRPDFVLIDGFSVPGCVIPQKRLIKGDCVSLSIAAASIVAKVTRDRMLLQMHARFPAYGFDRHKGYATADHLAALAQFGPCEEHRKSFAPIARTVSSGELFT